MDKFPDDWGRRRSGGGGGKTNLASCVVATVFLILVAAALVAVFLVFFRPRDPKIQVNAVQFPGFSAANGTVSFTFTQYVAVRNPNRAAFSHYDSTLELAYADNQVGFMFIPAGQIDGGRTQYMAANFTDFGITVTPAATPSPFLFFSFLFYSSSLASPLLLLPPGCSSLRWWHGRPGKACRTPPDVAPAPVGAAARGLGPASRRARRQARTNTWEPVWLPC